MYSAHVGQEGGEREEAPSLINWQLSEFIKKGPGPLVWRLCWDTQLVKKNTGNKNCSPTPHCTQVAEYYEQIIQENTVLQQTYKKDQLC